MAVLDCPSCAKKLRVADGSEGKRIRCPSCGHTIGATKLDAKPAAPASTAAAPSQTPPAAPPSPPTKAKPAGKPADTAGKPKPDVGSPDVKKLIAMLRPPKEEGELGRLGSYRILRILGYGGMGVVYEAQDVKLKRRVALKAMLPDTSDDASANKRFLREAQSVATVTHPNVVRIYEVNEDKAIPYLAMEYLQGESLEDRVLREGKLPEADALRIGRETAEALAAAHVHGIIHRDVKPSNIWLEEGTGTVKLLDFGLARNEEDTTRLTATGLVLGTPEYMSPEQARGFKLDGRSDLFSLGVVLYRAVTGDAPFKGVNAVAVLIAMNKTEPVSPQIANFELSNEFSELILKLLSKKPEDRFATGKDVAEAIKAIESGEAPAKASEEAPAPKKAAKKSGSMGLWIGLAAGLIVVVGAAVAGIIFWPR